MEASGFLISWATPAVRVVSEARLSARRSRASLARFSVTSSMWTRLPWMRPSRTRGMRVKERVRVTPFSRVNSWSLTFSWFCSFSCRNWPMSRSVITSQRIRSEISVCEKGISRSEALL